MTPAIATMRHVTMSYLARVFEQGTFLPDRGRLAAALHRQTFSQEASMGLLTGKYKYAVETAKGFHLDGTTEERDGKLFFKGIVQTQDQANKIWDAIKTIPDWKTE